MCASVKLRQGQRLDVVGGCDSRGRNISQTEPDLHTDTHTHTHKHTYPNTHTYTQTQLYSHNYKQTHSDFQTLCIGGEEQIFHTLSLSFPLLSLFPSLSLSLSLSPPTPPPLVDFSLLALFIGCASDSYSGVMVCSFTSMWLGCAFPNQIFILFMIKYTVILRTY